MVFWCQRCQTNRSGVICRGLWTQVWPIMHPVYDQSNLCHPLWQPADFRLICGLEKVYFRVDVLSRSSRLLEHYQDIIWPELTRQAITLPSTWDTYHPHSVICKSFYFLCLSFYYWLSIHLIFTCGPLITFSLLLFSVQDSTLIRLLLLRTGTFPLFIVHSSVGGGVGFEMSIVFHLSQWIRLSNIRNI